MSLHSGWEALLLRFFRFYITTNTLAYTVVTTSLTVKELHLIDCTQARHTKKSREL
jgi:hypothetical protein